MSLSAWLLTAFCACRLCCPGGHGITASGRRPVQGVTVACPRELPLGSVVLIKDVGIRTCDDRGSAITGHHLDVYLAAHSDARAFGVRRANVWILYQPSSAAGPSGGGRPHKPPKCGPTPQPATTFVRRAR